MPKPRTLEQNRVIHTLINRQDINADLKAEMVSRITNARCHSTKEMYFHEANQLIVELGGKPHDSARRTTQALEQKAGIIHLASRAQLELITAQGKIFFDSATGLETWITRRIGHYPPRTSKEAQSCIEGLKPMCKRKLTEAA